MPKENRVEKVGNMEEYLFRIVRKVTLTVKYFPFFYALGFLIFWLIAPTLSIDVITGIDGVIYISLIMVLFLIRLSYCVKLCVWHRLQCTLPLLPQIVDKIDTYIYEFGTYSVVANYAVFGVIGVLSLINAYFVFIKPSARNR